MESGFDPAGPAGGFDSAGGPAAGADPGVNLQVGRRWYLMEKSSVTVHNREKCVKLN